MRYVVPLGFVVGLAASCWRPDYSHCGSNQGDASCPSGMFCNVCEAEGNGCTAEQPSALCHFTGDDETATGSSTSTVGDNTSTPGDSGSTTVEDTGEPTQGTTTSSTDCVSDNDCTSPDAPFCHPAGLCVSCDELSDPDGACTAQDPTTPVCAAGACVQCTGEQPGACAGQTPVCNSDNTCTACTEHAQCPQSACHLDGSDAGACFDVADVTMVGNVTELSAALAALGPDDDAVFVLEAGTYGTTVNIGSNIELAILGNGMIAPTLAGNGPRSVEVFSNAIVYLGNIQISNTGVGGDGLSCSGTAVWLDDSTVRNNQLGMDISGTCAAHLRRTVINNNAAGGIEVSSGQLSMRNSAVGRNGDDLSSTVGGMRLDGTVVDITYSSIVGNETVNPDRGSMFCLGGEAGSIRNSIIVGAGSSIDGCDGIMFSHDALDDSGVMGTNLEDVGATMPTWFEGLGLGDFRLTATGQTIFDGLAIWEPGDPLTDIDGDPIATDSESTPGYDQPQ